MNYRFENPLTLDVCRTRTSLSLSHLPWRCFPRLVGGVWPSDFLHHQPYTYSSQLAISSFRLTYECRQKLNQDTKGMRVIMYYPSLSWSSSHTNFLAFLFPSPSSLFLWRLPPDRLILDKTHLLHVCQPIKRTNNNHVTMTLRCKNVYSTKHTKKKKIK